MDKKGSSFTGWTEGILLTMLFLMVLGGAVVTGMNDLYDKDHQTGFGNQTSATQASFSSLAGVSTDDVVEGEQVEVAEGFTLKSAWKIGRNLFKVIGDFITGGFITKAFSYIQVPPEVGMIVRLIYIISLILIILRMVFRVRA